MPVSNGATIMCSVTTVNANDYVLTPVAGERMDPAIQATTITIATAGTPPTAVGQRILVKLQAF